MVWEFSIWGVCVSVFHFLGPKPSHRRYAAPSRTFYVMKMLFIFRIAPIRLNSSLRWERCYLASPGTTLAPVILRSLFCIFYNTGGGSILVSGMVGSTTHVPYCHARLQFFARNSLLLFCINSFTIHCMFLTSLSPCEVSGIPFPSSHTFSINWLWLWCWTTFALIDVGGSDRANNS